MAMKKILTILFLLIAGVADAQFNYGIQWEENFNYPLNHINTAAYFQIQKHQLSVGPQYSHFFKPIVETPEKQNKLDYLGLHVAYKFIYQTQFETLKMYLECKYSMYQIEYLNYQGHVSGLRETKDFRLQNSIAIGFYAELFNQTFLLIGGGIASHEPFILHDLSYLPHLSVGLQYQLD